MLLGGNETLVVLCRHGNSYCTIVWPFLQRCIQAESSFSSNAHGFTIPDRADIIDKFILNKVSRDTAKMTTSGSQRGKRVKMLVVGAPRMSWGCVRYVEGRCIALVSVVRWISRSIRSALYNFFWREKKEKSARLREKLEITSFIKKEQKWCFLCGGWLYLTVPSKHVWFILVLQRCFSLSESGRFSFVEKEGKSVRERIGALDTQKTLVVLWSGVKSI